MRNTTEHTGGSRLTRIALVTLNLILLAAMISQVGGSRYASDAQRAQRRMRAADRVGRELDERRAAMFAGL